MSSSWKRAIISGYQLHSRALKAAVQHLPKRHSFSDTSVGGRCAMGVPEVRGMAKVCRNFKRFLVAQRITCKILIRAFCFPTSLKIAQWFSAVKSCSIRCLSSYYSEWCHTYHYALNLLLLLYILYIFKCVYTVEDKCTQMLHSYSQNIFWSCLFVNMYRKVTHTTDHDTRCYSVHVIIIFSCIVSYMWFTILPYDILM